MLNNQYDVINIGTGAVGGTLAHALASNRSHNVTFVSPGPIELPKETSGYSKAVMVRDPTGHSMKVIQR